MLLEEFIAWVLTMPSFPLAVYLPTAIADRPSLWLLIHLSVRRLCAQHLLPIASDWAYDWKLHRHREVADNAATLASSKNRSAAVRSLMQGI